MISDGRGPWLGHESGETTHHYVEANLATKEQALATLQETAISTRPYRPPEDLLTFLAHSVMRSEPT